MYMDTYLYAYHLGLSVHNIYGRPHHVADEMTLALSTGRLDRSGQVRYCELDGLGREDGLREEEAGPTRREGCTTSARDKRFG